MTRPKNRHVAAALLAGVLGLTACGSAPAPPAAPESPAPAASLGLMTSLPLYWPLGAAVGDIAAGRAEPPWQRAALEQGFALEPLDTLSPIPALSPDNPDLAPLANLTRLAIIQPRGFSPADNVALDTWVRAGGRLLLVLDPALTGHYDLPLGDPRLPSRGALIPPVVARWGMAIRFDDAQSSKLVDASLGGTWLPLVLSGEVTIIDPEAADCTLLASAAAARCAVGEGQVTLIADAAIFEHPELAGEGGAALNAVIRQALK